MANDNLTAVLYGIEDLRLEQRAIPEIADDEVLLKMDSVGICGSDVHYLVNGRIGDFVLTKPMVIGHEASGVVAKVGKKVKHLVAGDRVACEPGVPCRYCDHCKAGQYNLCPDMVFCATPPYDGNLTRYYKHAADFCYKLPDHVTMEEGALLEPLSVGVHACRRAGVGLGSKVLVLGAGPIGLVTLLSAQAMGADQILITDLVQQRLDVAKELGATHTLLINKDDSAEATAKKIHKVMGAEPDKSIDCCGAESTTRLSIFATRSGGCVVIVGMGAPEPKIPLINALAREVDIRGVFRYCNDYPAALALVASGKVNVKKLITHHFDITETAKAFETARYGLGGAIKATRSGGCVVIVGMGAPEPKIPLINALAREVDIRGVFRYCNDYPAALALVASGKVNVKKLITHHFDITETAKAFETARYGLGGAIKVMIHVQPKDTNNKV